MLSTAIGIFFFGLYLLVAAERIVTRRDAPWWLVAMAFITLAVTTLAVTEL